MVRRGELYRVSKPTKRDPKSFRVFVIVGRQEVIASNYSTVICAPVYSNCLGLETEVEIDIDEGLKHHSCIRCDELYSLPKAMLTNYVGTLPEQKLEQLNSALKVALVIK
ncbi:MAG: type II toxin-antitoxin system PemK/MazF family toxin [Pyrinomonadaceae bacterium MAG19_C2-C3]|nr:type II toxin-antitoxin system PemK/MazF family toxin [Pyrinomonadaceae bacterium MAG19_C2-C3]